MDQIIKRFSKVGGISGLVFAFSTNMGISNSWCSPPLSSPSSPSPSPSHPSSSPSPPPPSLSSIPDCHVPSCQSKAELFAKSLGALGNGKQKQQTKEGEGKEKSFDRSKIPLDHSPADDNINNSGINRNNSDSNSSSSSSLKIKEASQEGSPPPKQCPLDREELGRSAWDLIHTVAAFYPDKPSDIEQAAARSLIMSLALLYPCPICAVDLQNSVVSNPPKVESRIDFALWCCNLHNEVNRKLHKNFIFKCDIESLDKRWRDGPECWNQLFEERKDS